MAFSSVLRTVRWAVRGFLLVGLSVISAYSYSPIELNAKAVALMKQGLCEEALPQLLEASRALPYEPVIRRNLAECYLMLGVRKLQSRDFEEAIDLFQEGKGYADKDARFWAFSGIAFMHKGDTGAAEVEFNEALALTDDAPDILYQLGELYYSQGELHRARQVLEEAFGAQPEDLRIVRLLEKVNRELPVEEQMSSTRGGNFVISCDEELHPKLGSEILEILEAAYNDLGSEFGFYPEILIPVLVYPHQTYGDLTGAPGWSAGVYDGKIRIPAGGIDRGSALLKSILYHEYSHVLVGYLARGRIPFWLNEGLAEVAGRRFFSPPPPEDEKLTFLLWTDLEDSFEKLESGQVRSAYYQSYLMVTYLIEHFGRYKLNELVVAAGRETDFSKAVADVYADFKVDYKTLQDEWSAHFQGR